MKVYRRLETPKIYANVYAETISDTGVLTEGALTDASSSMKIIIEDKTGEVVQALADMQKDDDGKYSFPTAGDEYTISATANLGIYNYECRAASGTKVATGRGSFEVKEQVA